MRIGCSAHLACVDEPVGVAFPQQVVLCQAPQLEHLQTMPACQDSGALRQLQSGMLEQMGCNHPVQWEANSSQMPALRIT